MTKFSQVAQLIINEYQTMKLTILGSGSYLPSFKRHSACYLLEAGEEKIAFDFGRGAVENLIKLGIDYKNLDRLFVTHLHPDHVADLVSFMQIMLHAAPDFGLRQKDFYLYGPKGFKQFYLYLCQAFPDLITPDKVEFKVIIEELDEDEIKINDLTVKSFKVSHYETLNSVAYRFEEDQKSIFYSGDINTDPNNFRGLVGVDLAILESTRSVPAKGHLSVADAAKIATGYNVRKLVLSHISDLLYENFDILGEAKKYFKNEVIVAEDMMEFEV